MSSLTRQRRRPRFAPEVRAAAAIGAAEPNEARIGPNSVLQLVQVLDTHVGEAARQALMREAGLMALPADNGLMPEGPAARLHQALRRGYPAEAASLLAGEAGERTGDYILAHRIPHPAQRLLRVLPRSLATRLLAGAIGKHAWTFAGSGDFRVARGRPLTFELHDNPVVRGEHATQPLCHWHAAVFQRLFNALVSADIRCVETHCCAMGAPACRFAIH